MGKFLSRRAHRLQPTQQVADGGGGGPIDPPPDPPTVIPNMLADITTPTPGYDWIDYGGIGHSFSFSQTTQYNLWKTWGFTGHAGGIDQANGRTINFKGSTSQNDAVPGQYDWQRAIEGFGVPSLNGSSSNVQNTAVGALWARKNGIINHGGFVRNIAPGTTFDWTTDAGRQAEADKYRDQAKFLKFFMNGMSGVFMMYDLEVGSQWGIEHDAGNNPVYTADTAAQARAYDMGYKLGFAMWDTSAGNYKNLDFYWYDYKTAGCWHLLTTSTPSPYFVQNVTREKNKDAFIAGVAKAHLDCGSTGKMVHMNHWYYRGVQFSGAQLTTALKWDIQSRMASMSAAIIAFAGQATWDHIAPYIGTSPFTWAGTDGDSYYTNSQQIQPDYTNDLATYVKYAMHGRMFEFEWGNAAINGWATPGGNTTTGGSGRYAGGNNYLSPAGRIAGMQAAFGQANTYNSEKPTITSNSGVNAVVTADRSGTQVRIRFNFKHTLGAAYSIYKVHNAAGTQTGQGAFPLTHNLRGGSPTGGIGSSTQDVDFTVQMDPNTYLIVECYSAQGQRFSVRQLVV